MYIFTKMTLKITRLNRKFVRMSQTYVVLINTAMFTERNKDYNYYN